MVAATPLSTQEVEITSSVRVKTAATARGTTTGPQSRSWPRLRGWLETTARFRLWQEQVHVAVTPVA
jgi:hypothetical protein